MAEEHTTVKYVRKNNFFVYFISNLVNIYTMKANDTITIKLSKRNTPKCENR